MSEELTGEALTERARELDIHGRSNMNADELRAAIAEAEAADPVEEDVAEVESPVADDSQAPFTAPIPQTGVADMTYSPSTANMPSVGDVELPAGIHQNRIRPR